MSCSEDSVKNTSLTKRAIGDKIQDFKTVNCSTTDGCYIPPSTCQCSSSSYSRQNLDPCDYSSIQEFAEALACELTKVSNSCQQQGFQLGCQAISSPICLDLGLEQFTTVDQSLLDIVNDGNPFQYCSEANCDEYTCDNAEYPLHHYVITIAYQNAIIAWLRSVGSNIWQCESGSTIVAFKMEFRVCDSGAGCNESTKEENCHDLNLVVRFSDFMCCPQ